MLPSTTSRLFFFTRSSSLLPTEALILAMQHPIRSLPTRPSVSMPSANIHTPTTDVHSVRRIDLYIPPLPSLDRDTGTLAVGWQEDRDIYEALRKLLCKLACRLYGERGWISTDLLKATARGDSHEEQVKMIALECRCFAAECASRTSEIDSQLTPRLWAIRSQKTIFVNDIIGVINERLHLINLVLAFSKWPSADGISLSERVISRLVDKLELDQESWQIRHGELLWIGLQRDEAMISSNS